MNLKSNARAWWGPPKQFSVETEERKVSWLELFYDLVYVIAIAKITHHLSEHLDVSGVLNYIYFFAMIFWGWLNGSLYHDLHGSEGLRTRLMTLWQMLIIAALVITLESPPDNLVYNVTIVIMIMQLYITYLWWSVGIYDKFHRRLNRPYTYIYLLSFGLMFSTFFLDQPYIRIVFFLTLLLNYLPPFISHRLLKRESMQLNLTSSMSERLGLFTIIVFGEVIAGVINGISQLRDLSFGVWVHFSLAVFIVFALWWIFFTLVSDRKCKPGFVKGSLLEILYIPTLIALGLMGLAFTGIFESHSHAGSHFLSLREIFGYSMCLFLLGINLMMFLLEYPAHYIGLIQRVHLILLLGMVGILVMTLVHMAISLMVYLILILSLLLTIILLLNYNWYSKYSKEG